MYVLFCMGMELGPPPYGRTYLEGVWEQSEEDNICN
jgi:hypothetical protein